MNWLLLNALISLATLLALAALRSAPHRTRFFLCLAALACWFLPLGHMSLPRDSRPDFLGILPFVLPAADSSLLQEPELGLLERLGAFLLTPPTLGLACLLGLSLFSFQLRRHRRLLKHLESNASDGNTLWESFPELTRVPIGIVAAFKGAMTTGIRKPKIWVGDRHLNGSALPGLLLHEQTHIRHKDNLTLFLITLTRCLFWWNPLVHFLGSRARFHQELACDQACQRLLGNEEYRFQLATLLMEQWKTPSGALACGIGSNSNIRRLKLLERSFYMKIRHYLVLLLLIAGGGLLVAHQGTLPEAARQTKQDFKTGPSGEKNFSGFNISIIDIKDQPITDLLRFLADHVGFHLVLPDANMENLRGTYSLKDIPWDQALDIILTNADCAYTFRDNVLTVVRTQYAGEKGLLGTPISIDLQAENESVGDLIQQIAEEVGVEIKVEESFVDRTVSCNLTDAPWRLALSTIAAHAGMKVVYRHGNYHVLPAEKVKNPSQKENQLVSAPFELAYLDGQFAVQLVKDFLSEKGTVVLSKDGRTLLIHDSPLRVEKAFQALNRVDK